MLPKNRRRWDGCRGGGLHSNSNYKFNFKRTTYLEFRPEEGSPVQRNAPYRLLDASRTQLEKEGDSVTPLRSVSIMEYSNNPDGDCTHDITARILA